MKLVLACATCGAVVALVAVPAGYSDPTPAVVSSSPAAGDPAAPPNSSTGLPTVTVTFNEPMAPSSFTTATFYLTDGSGTKSAGAYACNSTTSCTTVTMTVSHPLNVGATYTVNLTSGVTSQGSTPLPATSWTFTTGPAVPYKIDSGAVPPAYAPASGYRSDAYYKNTTSTPSWVTLSTPNIGTAYYTSREGAFLYNAPVPQNCTSGSGTATCLYDVTLDVADPTSGRIFTVSYPASGATLTIDTTTGGANTQRTYTTSSVPALGYAIAIRFAAVTGNPIVAGIEIAPH